MGDLASIVKAYDIRGLYGEQMDAEIANSIGRAFAQVIGALEGKPTRELRLGLGRDMRLTAPELAAAYRDVGVDLVIVNLPHHPKPDSLKPLAEALGPLA